MAVPEFGSGFQLRSVQMWIFLLCLFPCWADSHTPSAVLRKRQDQFSSDFTYDDNRKWLPREIEKNHENRNKQLVNILDWKESLTAGETPHSGKKLFNFNQESSEDFSDSFKLRPQRIHNTFKVRSRDIWKQLQPTQSRVGRKSKDYVFRDVIGSSIEQLHSYAVKTSRKENKGPLWLITVVSGALVVVMVVFLCVHAPCGCLWRRHRRKQDVSCPIAGAHKEMCGKCFLKSNATNKEINFQSRPHQVTVNMHSSHTRCLSSSSQYNALPWESKSAADFRYKPLKNRNKRDSLHSMYDPEWTSVGAFLNKNRPSNSYHGYGSLKEAESKFVDRYCRRSHDSIDNTEEVVECALKLRPRRRQVIELQEFPLGYSKSFLNINLESNPDVLFDPYRDQLKRGKKFGRLTFSDSDLRELSCTDKLGSYDSKSDLFSEAKPRKSSLKMVRERKKTHEKVVHFFPSNFEYDAQFVQFPSTRKMKANAGEFNRSYGESGYSKLSKSDNETSEIERTKSLCYVWDKTTQNKEHAVDEELTSPTTDEVTYHGKFMKSHDYGCSYTNYGCKSSTEELTTSQERPGISSLSAQSFHKSSDSEWKTRKNVEPGSFCKDAIKDDQNYQLDPLAGLLSPIRKATEHEKGPIKNKQEAAVIPVTAPNTKAPFAVTPSSSCIFSGDVISRKTRKSTTELENAIFRASAMPHFEQIQRFPERERKFQNSN